MNSSSNLLVLGATGQVGSLVAKHLKRSEANFSVGTRRKANLEELADQFGASRFIDLDDPQLFEEQTAAVGALVRFLAGDGGDWRRILATAADDR